MSSDEIHSHLNFIIGNLFGDGTAGAPYGRLRTLVAKTERAVEAITRAADAIDTAASAVERLYKQKLLKGDESV